MIFMIVLVNFVVKMIPIISKRMLYATIHSHFFSHLIYLHKIISKTNYLKLATLDGFQNSVSENYESIIQKFPVLSTTLYILMKRIVVQTK